LINQAEATIVVSDMIDATMAEEVAGRVKMLRKSIADGPLTSSPTLREILAALPLLDVGLSANYEEVAMLTAAIFCNVDIATTKLALVERFVKAFDAVVDSKKQIAQQHLNRFIGALRRGSFAAYRDAESIVEQV